MIAFSVWLIHNNIYRHRGQVIGFSLVTKTPRLIFISKYIYNILFFAKHILRITSKIEG